MTNTNFPKATIEGYPRVGANRELKRALESYWAGRIDAETFESAAHSLRLDTYNRLRDLGLTEDYAIPADVAYYDQVLETALTVGAVAGETLDDEFTLARGNKDTAPLEMTKWFDTNYHYIVPELAADTEFRLDDAALLADPDWLLPHLGGARTAAALRALDLTEPLKALIGWDGQRRLDEAAPAAFTTPLGRRIPIDYDAETPTIEARLQELFGVTRPPMAGRRPLRIQMLSPGGKSVAVTTDLPGFWAGGYADVRKDMRGRYPKHPWPEDPAAALPTTRAKPRG